MAIHCNTDLRDLYRGALSYRRLWVLISRLPMDSWTQTILRDQAPEHGLTRREAGEQKFGPWALDNYQLATLTDAVRHLTYITAVAGHVEPPPEAPKPTPRPGANRAKVKALTPAGVAYLNKLRAPKGA